MSPREVQILLVEDNPKDVKLTLHALKSKNLCTSIDVARDGEEALDYLFCRGQHSDRSIDQPPRLILLDLKLPKIDGLDVLREVKGNPLTKSIPVVILTGSSEEKDLVTCYRIGVNAYIQKPVDFDRFTQIVEQVGTFWLGINLFPPPAAFGPE